MRKVDIDFTDAVNKGVRGNFDNTRVDVVNTTDGGTRVEVYLHGNNICALQRDANGYMNNWFISTCGFDTNVTNARLNAFVSRCIPPNGISIRKKNFATHWYFDGRDMGCLSTLNMSDYVAAIAHAEGGAK